MSLDDWNDGTGLNGRGTFKTGRGEWKVERRLESRRGVGEAKFFF